MDWKIIESKYVLKEKWITVRADRCEMPGGMIIDPFYVLEYPDWVNVVPVTRNMEFIMIRQYRHGIRRTILELPCGGIDRSDGTPLDAARRELHEETGYSCDRLVQLSRLAPNPASHSNWSYSFIALDAVKAHEQNLEDTEQIEVELFTVAEMKKLLKEDRIPQAMHVASLYQAFEYLGVYTGLAP